MRQAEKIGPFCFGMLILCLALSPAHGQPFTQVTELPFVNDYSNAYTASWGDYDNDGDLDLYLTNGWGAAAQANFLYRQEQDGSFTRITEGQIVLDVANSAYGAWGDYDNDGFLDLYVTNAFGQNNRLYRNNGDGRFTSILAGPHVSDGSNSRSGSWGDYDNDGDLDLFVANSSGQNNALFENNGDGTFSQITTGSVVNDGGTSIFAIWGDFDDDGDLDLYVANGGGAQAESNFLYLNTLSEIGVAGFNRITSGAIAADVEPSISANWIDYDNDNDLDLYVTNIGGFNNSLYVNNGDGTFAKNTNSNITTDGGNILSSGWADYDNDGDLDLFQTHNSSTPVFYSNEGDGTFSRNTSEVVDRYPFGGSSTGVTWVDYDSDGDIDLMVTAAPVFLNSRLYRNDQNNGNSWINLKLVGTTSNTSAIGAKVRAKASIGGAPRWQMKYVVGLTGWFGSNSLDLGFGFGDAGSVDSLMVQWPSGTVDIFTEVEVNQFLTVTEGSALKSSGDVIANAGGAVTGQPSVFSLHQNYPNPFNPSTTIRYELPSNLNVTLRVYDMQGSEVATLIDRTQPAGFHTVSWNGLNAENQPVSSGVYVYRLQTNNVISSKKMILLR